MNNDDSKCLKCGAHGLNVLGKDMLCAHCCRTFAKYHDPKTCPWCMKSYFDITPFGDGGVHKKILKPGDVSSLFPLIGNRCQIQFIARLLDGDIFDTTREKVGDTLIGGTDDPFEGAIDRRQLPCIGIDMALKTMGKNELCDLIIREDYGFGKKGLEPKVIPGATVNYELQLMSWKDVVVPIFPTEAERLKYEQEKKEKERRDMIEHPPPTPEEQLEASNKEKELGNIDFKNGDYEKANEHYDSAFVSIFHTDEQWNYMVENHKELTLSGQKVILHQNRGICHLKLHHLREARWDLSQCLKFDPFNLKGLYNHAQLYIEYAKEEMDKENKNEYWDVDRCYAFLETTDENIRKGMKQSPNNKSFIELANKALAVRKQIDFYDKRYKKEQKKLFGNKLANEIDKHLKNLKDQNIDPEFEDMPPLEDYDCGAEYSTEEKKD